MDAKKPQKTPSKKAASSDSQKFITMTERQANLLTKAMDAKDPSEALAKAVELATRKTKQ